MIKIIEKAEWNLNEIQKKSRDEFINWANSNNIVDSIEKCPNCGEKSFSTLSKVDRFGLNFEALKCNKCKLIITSPQIKEFFLPEYYNKFYHPLIFGETEAKDYLFDVSQGEKIFNLTYPYIRNKKNLKVFEIGAGSGSNLKGFSDTAIKKGITCTLKGLEFSENYVKKASEFGIQLCTESIEQYIKTNDTKYDLIILSHVFEHVNNLEKFLSSVKKLMNEDTLLYIEVPGVLTLHKNNAYACNFKRYLVHAHLYHFTAETLKNILEKNSFKLEYINEMVESIFRLKSEKSPTATVESNVEIYLNNLQKYKLFYCIPNILKRIKNKIYKVIK